MSEYPYVFRWGAPNCCNPVWIKYKGKPCRVLKRGKKNSCLLEFEDGSKIITSRNAIKKVERVE